MSVFAHVDGLGDEIEGCIADSILSWRKEFCREEEVCDTLAECLTDVESTINLRPAGICLVTVLCRARKPMNSAVYCFRLRRRKVGRWERGASSIPRR